MLLHVTPGLEVRIENFLREGLGDGFVRVSFEDENDGDGDPILIINVVTRERPQPATRRGVTRGLMSMMADETDIFPLLSYRSPDAQSRSVRAAA